MLGNAVQVQTIVFHSDVQEERMSNMCILKGLRHFDNTL